MIGLFSLGDKAGLVQVAQALSALDPDWQFYGSKGTATQLKLAGAPAQDVAGLVGDPSPDHLVVTLSKIHFGILCDATREDHMSWLREQQLPYIDLVWVTLYDIQSAIATHNENAVRAATDMGGVALLRSAAKGRRLVASNLLTMGRIVQWLREGQPEPEQFRRWLAMKAEQAVKAHVEASSEFLLAEMAKRPPYTLPEPANLSA